MTDYQPNHYGIFIKPIYVDAGGKEFPFAGLKEEEDNSEPIEYKFIVDILRLYFGNDLNLNEKTLTPGTMEIDRLSNVQMKILRGIYEDTYEEPIKYGRSHLKFEVLFYSYDNPPCDDNCDCCECLGCCSFKKN